MASSEPAHGNLTPPRISPSCPHCMILRSSRAVAGQEYHCILCRSWPHREPPVFYRPPFLAHTDRMTEKISRNYSSIPYLMARLLNRLLLIALAKGKLPMNEYAVVKEQAKGEVQKELLSPIVLKPWGCQPCSAKNFFNFSMARFRDLATA